MDRTERPVSDRVLTAPVGCGPTTEVRFRRVEGLGTVPPREVEDQTTWLATLQGEAPLHALRLQGLDLTEHRDLLLARDDLSDLVILGGRLDDEVEAHLRAHGSIIFPSDPRAPVDPYRGRLYTAQELFAGVTTDGYEATVDARAYRWFADATVRHDAYVTALRAIHDDAMSDALTQVVRGRRVVGVMGGHALRRGTDEFAAAALMGHRLATGGALVVTGGGPGAMEAANLGAWALDEHELAAGLTAISTVPDFVPDIGEWVRPALDFRLTSHVDAGNGDGPRPFRSLGIPTWYYGHEPPNAFAQLIAKFFSNALREDLLLAHSTHGLVVLPGAAGTVQEVFQMATRLYYEVDATEEDGRPARPLTPLVLVGMEHWTSRLPVWPLLRALGDGRRMGQVLHLVDTVEEAAALLHATP